MYPQASECYWFHISKAGASNLRHQGAFIATKHGMEGEEKDKLINTLVYLVRTSFDIQSSSAGLNTRSLGFRDLFR